MVNLSPSTVSFLLFASLSSQASSLRNGIETSLSTNDSAKQRGLQFIPGDLCRCQAPGEDFYPSRRHLTEVEEIAKHTEQSFVRSLQTLDPITGLYIVDGVFVLPDSDPNCASSTAAFGTPSATGTTSTYRTPEYHRSSGDPDVFATPGNRNLMNAADSDTHEKDQQRNLQQLGPIYHKQAEGEPETSAADEPETSQITTRGSRPYGTIGYAARPDYGKGK
jgi:hypothetical protein